MMTDYSLATKVSKVVTTAYDLGVTARVDLHAAVMA